jgi:SRSO17 transposase
MDDEWVDRKKAMMSECVVDPEWLAGVLPRMDGFLKPFKALLSVEEQRGHLVDHVVGLCSPVQRKTSETIAYFHGQDRQALQRFIGTVAWDHRPLLREVARQVGKTLGEPDGVLVLDPSAFSKKGTESVGVQRQWNGRLGKVDNCQVGVYLGYVSRIEQTLVDVRLFLPEQWASNKERRAKCHVPPEIKFATKLELGLEMVVANRALLPHAWVVGDDEFGRSTGFRRNLREIGEQYLLAVPSNTLVRDLEAEPSAEGGSGKHRLAPFVRVDKWAAQLPATEWTEVDTRDAEKGPLLVHTTTRRVLGIQERRFPEREEMLVITRRVEDGKIIHDYWLSNASPQTTPQEFARAAKSRGQIERCFQRSKNEAGLGDYETRSWQGWHHHQALSLVATWFLVDERLRGEKKDTSDHPVTTPSGHLHHLARCRQVTTAKPHATNPNPTSAKRSRSLLSLQKTQTVTTTARTPAEMT